MKHSLMESVKWENWAMAYVADVTMTREDGTIEGRVLQFHSEQEANDFLPEMRRIVLARLEERKP